MTWYQLYLTFTAFTIAFLTTETTTNGQQTGSRIESEFRRLDQNSDEMLSSSEFDRGNQMFNAMDANRDSFLTLAEVTAYIRARGGSNRGAPSSEPTEFVGAFSTEMPVTLHSCREATRYSNRSTGHAVLVMHKGRIVFESYSGGWDKDTPHRLASGTKSFAGIVAIVAVKEKILSLDEKVALTINEWNVDSRSRITIRQLLSLTSGIDPGENEVVLPYDQAVDSKVKHSPGETFQYGPNPFQIFGELMNRKLRSSDLDYLTFLNSRILEPIGMEFGRWRRTKDGDPHVPSGAFLTARNWAKFGELLRLQGTWNGVEVFSSARLKELTTGSKANPRYGVTFWLGTRSGSGSGNNTVGQSTSSTVNGMSLENMFMAAGKGKQRLYVLPDQDLVVVRFGESQGRQFSDQSFLTKLLHPAKR